MHRLPTRSAIWRLRIASLLLWLSYTSCAAFIAIMILSVITRNQAQVKINIYLMLVFLASVILQWLMAQNTKCPLCITPVLAAKSCSKNRKAKKMLGSYRLRVATLVLCRNRFRCPYCNEPTQLVVRDRRSQRAQGSRN